MCGGVTQVGVEFLPLRLGSLSSLPGPVLCKMSEWPSWGSRGPTKNQDRVLYVRAAVAQRHGGGLIGPFSQGGALRRRDLNRSSSSCAEL